MSLVTTHKVNYPKNRNTHLSLLALYLIPLGQRFINGVRVIDLPFRNFLFLILSDCQINLCEKSDSSRFFLFSIRWLWHLINNSSFSQVRTFSNSIQRLCSSEVTRYSWSDDASITARLFSVLRGWSNSKFLPLSPVSKARPWQLAMITITLRNRNFIFNIQNDRFQIHYKCFIYDYISIESQFFYRLSSTGSRYCSMLLNFVFPAWLLEYLL